MKPVVCPRGKRGRMHGFWVLFGPTPDSDWHFPWFNEREGPIRKQLAAYIARVNRRLALRT